ncbi:hypothetical protein EJ05DRAFT_260480 [Pseudovirgaria hyperparasitica]|uniref:Uncharacterized protein n=1 Tax=Pseudovirgaria hyperparasitica TaxID=470096 RepID=A0A6A6WF52_9PEZI|nr:uncharacterized protein EJ05DRAFT_260480 [Pseudovirgaria hyperparasitica]KAF2761353.1 hypothetical protein EJ05DRAFT_260480 [Pseudovirgaria hyperparasitica]
MRSFKFYNMQRTVSQNASSSPRSSVEPNAAPDTTQARGSRITRDRRSLTMTDVKTAVTPDRAEPSVSLRIRSSAEPVLAPAERSGVQWQTNVSDDGDISSGFSSFASSTTDLSETREKDVPILRINTGHLSSNTSSHRSPLLRSASSTSSSPKSALAEPAVTHVTVSPSKTGPAVEIVNSPAGRYDVIWDEQLGEREQSGLISPTKVDEVEPPLRPTAGIDIVTKKLSYWAWSGLEHPLQRSRSEPSLEILPVVQPQSTTMEATPSLPVPPNSMRTSQRTSGHSSQQSRQASPLPPNLNEADERLIKQISGGDHLEVPDLVPTRRDQSSSDSSDGTNSPQLLTDPKFGFHRDSVALARDRLFKTSGIQPERFARKDSLAVARARISRPKPQHEAQAMTQIAQDRPVHFFPRSGCASMRRAREQSSEEEDDNKADNRRSAHIVIVEPVKPSE